MSALMLTEHMAAPGI